MALGGWQSLKVATSTNPGHCVKFLLGPSGRQPAVKLMWPLPVVALHQKPADILLCQRSAHVAHGRYPFRFQTAKQPFHRRVVVAVSTSAHALLKTIAPQSLTEASAAVLASLDALLNVK
ncbi:hypothetical protein D3C77_221440 [compost metagenome]